MIFDLHNEQDTERQAFTGMKPTFFEGVTNLKWMGQKAMEHAASGGKAAAMTGSIIFPSEDIPREQDPDRIFPRKEDFGRFMDTYIEPAIKYWTPNPDEVGHASQILGNVVGMAVAGGPGNIALNAAMNTGSNLIDQGVDPTTATVAGIGAGAVGYALTALPQTGKTLLGKIGLAAVNLPIGIAQDLALKKGLESQGYKEQAAGIDPYDPVSRGTDVLIGTLFGGLAHFSKVKEHLPVEVADAIDISHNHDKIKAANPFNGDANPTMDNAHVELYNKAVQDVEAGRPVDVSTMIRERMTEANKPASGPLEPQTSRLLREIDALPQEKWSPQDLLNKIRKTDGVKPDEIALTGLENFLKGKKNVTRSEVREYLDNNQQTTDLAREQSTHQAAPEELTFRTEPHPEATRARDLAAKETSALADDLAREFPEYSRRTMPPHQDAAPWSMTREELFSARDNTRDWYDNLERSILGDQVKEWRRAVRRGDTQVTDLIESRLKPEEVNALYGVGTKYSHEDFAHLADARDTVRAGLEVNGYTEKNLASEIASALYKVGDKNDPAHMTPAEQAAYAKLDEAFKVIQERGMDSKAVSNEALKQAAGHFPDPEDALIMLNRFVNRDQQATQPGKAAPAGLPQTEAPQAEGITTHPAESPDAMQTPSPGERSDAIHTQPPEGGLVAAHDAHDTLASNVETLLREHGDVSLVRHDADGQPVSVSARQVIDEARAEIERTKQLEKAYERAALCLELG